MERARSAPASQLFALAAVTSAFWTYHGPYDFVVLLPAILPLAGWSDRPPARRWSIAGFAAFAIVALALTPWIYNGEHLFARMIRWAGRATVMGLFAHAYLRAYGRGDLHGAPPTAHHPDTQP